VSGSDADRREAMIAAVVRRLEGCRTVAVGASSPMPAAAALLARARWGTRVLMLGNAPLDRFTEGGRELFDLAAQGRIDAFFLSGGQIDGTGNVNLLEVGALPGDGQRFPGSFGSPYLAMLVPRLILFREEHSAGTLPERVDAISAPGTSPPGTFRPGGPIALVTNRCVFAFERERGGFRLESVHPGHTLEEVLDHTGFAFTWPENVPATTPASPEHLALMRTVVAPLLAETYPRFAADVFGISSSAA
jgi:glutaconate CoA-transferase subunit B